MKAPPLFRPTPKKPKPHTKYIQIMPKQLTNDMAKQSNISQIKECVLDIRHAKTEKEKYLMHKMGKKTHVREALQRKEESKMIFFCKQ